MTSDRLHVETSFVNTATGETNWVGCKLPGEPWRSWAPDEFAQATLFARYFAMQFADTTRVRSGTRTLCTVNPDASVVMA